MPKTVEIKMQLVTMNIYRLQSINVNRLAAKNANEIHNLVRIIPHNVIVTRDMTRSPPNRLPPPKRYCYQFVYLSASNFT